MWTKIKSGKENDRWRGDVEVGIEDHLMWLDSKMNESIHFLYMYFKWYEAHSAYVCRLLFMISILHTTVHKIDWTIPTLQVDWDG